ncbi:hypothetical protein EHS13_18710 [Paenibacillus psychroresistens]|uniref:Accessory regulator AgrB n=1 Tax=Paenibacillus psychroresistens TaxID=1778678 RepID=A0A6B8RLY1_9BACL|nr:accessory gene regulator B family protein [Paenibacillus psychroresistens]QGQ96764.1 hypothetical protein EHS13_18710 [Paenibacillus psychroresistens]
MTPIVYRLADNIAQSIRRNDPESSSIEVLRFALIALINAVIVIGSMLVVGALTGHFLDTLIASFAFPVLRYFSGGMHLRSSALCNVISVVIIAICVYTPMEYWYNGLVLNALSIGFLAIYAPSGIKQSKMKKENYFILKCIAILIVSTDFIFHSSVLSIALFAQSVTTVPIFEKWLDRINW